MPCGPPKSGMGDLDPLDERRNPALFETLNPRVVMIGLNVASRSLSGEPFRNFHDPSPVANDFKIRFAFMETEFWGAYMTDVIKDLPETQSGRLLKHLREHPEIIPDHIDRLRSEMADLGHAKPLVLAFGAATHSILRKHLDTGDYSHLVGITHYSHHISKERYRATVLGQIATEREPFA